MTKCIFPKMPCAFHFVCFGSRCSRKVNTWRSKTGPWPMTPEIVQPLFHTFSHGKPMSLFDPSPRQQRHSWAAHFQDVHRICVGVTRDNMWQHQVTETYYRRLQKRDSGWDFVIDGSIFLAASKQNSMVSKNYTGCRMVPWHYRMQRRLDWWVRKIIVGSKSAMINCSSGTTAGHSWSV